MNNEKYVKFIDLGYVVAKLSKRNEHSAPTVMLFQDGGVDEGAYYPPSALTVVGEAGLIELRDELTKLLAVFPKEIK